MGYPDSTHQASARHCYWRYWNVLLTLIWLSILTLIPRYAKSTFLFIHISRVDTNMRLVPQNSLRNKKALRKDFMCQDKYTPKAVKSSLFQFQVQNIAKIEIQVHQVAFSNQITVSRFTRFSLPCTFFLQATTVILFERNRVTVWSSSIAQVSHCVKDDS